MKKRIDKIFFLTIIGITSLSVNAQADILIYDRLEGGSGDVQNVLFNDFNSNEISLTVDGFLNRTGQIVNFTGTELLETPSGGQARIEAGDGGAFSSLFFAFEDPTLGFDKVQFNIDAVNDGFVNLTFTDQFGTDWTGSSPYEVNGAGQNFFTAVAISGQVISSVTIESSGLEALSDLAQVRMNPTPITNGVVPEPATLVLLGAGMAGVGFLRSKRRRK